MTNKIDCFDGEYEFLSNFYLTPILFEGVIYNCVESAFQAAKTIKLDDRLQFQTMSAGKSKRAGRKLILRKDWESIKTEIMLQLVRYKFQSNIEIRQKLIDTNPLELIEGNYWHDYYWGVCNGKGVNMLGQILMKVRKELL